MRKQPFHALPITMPDSLGDATKRFDFTEHGVRGSEAAYFFLFVIAADDEVIFQASRRHLRQLLNRSIAVEHREHLRIISQRRCVGVHTFSTRVEYS
jgi:hypothetical protein